MNKKRNVYLNMKTLEEARKVVDQSFSLIEALETETIAVPDTVGRVLAAPVSAVISAPHFNAAAMDGIAVKAEVSFGASEADSKRLIINQNAFYVNTGHVMPAGTDATRFPPDDRAVQRARRRA